MVGWLHVSGPVVRQNIMAERCGGTERFTLWQPGSKKNSNRKWSG
jgi:hypothetical protein